jgi:hypothetical protein
MSAVLFYSIYLSIYRRACSVCLILSYRISIHRQREHFHNNELISPTTSRESAVLGVVACAGEDS